MRQTVILVAGVALLGLCTSGCSMTAFRPASAKSAVAVPVAAAVTPPKVEPKAAQPEGDVAQSDDAPLTLALAFAAPNVPTPFQPAVATVPSGRPALDPLITKYASLYNVPERLVRRVIVRESGYNPGARNGPFYGLMQISHATARGMGYTGSPGGLLDAETNLRYAAKYLAGAYVTAEGNEDQAMRFYASGYYYDAKRKGLLEEAGLR